MTSKLWFTLGATEAAALPYPNEIMEAVKFGIERTGAIPNGMTVEDASASSAIRLSATELDDCAHGLYELTLGEKMDPNNVRQALIDWGDKRGHKLEFQERGISRTFPSIGQTNQH